MIKMPRSQSTTIKNMMYPESKKVDKTYLTKNMQAIKQKQQENRVKKEDKENAIPGIIVILFN